MNKHSRNVILFSFLGCLVVSGPVAAAETATQEKGEPALAVSHDEKGLAWGACPSIFPQDDTCRVTVLHGDPAKDNADVFIKLTPGTKLEHHKHTSAERMILVAGQLQVAYDGQDPAVLTTGTYAYGPPELPHTAECIGSQDCVLFIAFEQPVDAIAMSE